MLGTFRGGRNSVLQRGLLSNCRPAIVSKIPWFSLIHTRNNTNASTCTDASVTNLQKLILRNIKTTGPLSFATYMQLCLSHPTFGYYMNPSNHIFGPRGDFITSPEITQVFGELVGVWLLSQWESAGRPPAIRLIELGPGRGTLMADLILVLAKLAGMGSLKNGPLLEVHLVETSPSLRALQKNLLLPLSERDGWKLLWHDSIDDVPQDSGKYTMLVAHEFFDALPIHVLEKTHQGWQEVLIASTPDPVHPEGVKIPADPSTSSSAPLESASHLHRVLSPKPTPTSTLLGLSSPRFRTLPIGSHIEVSPASFKIARKIGEVLSTSEKTEEALGGCALIIDYGGDHVFGNSARAFKEHQIVDVFHRPGECDLTTNVDFAYLKEAFSDIATPHGPLSQATFFGRMGLVPRIAMLTKILPQERKKPFHEAAMRVVDPTGMGKQYQVLGITCNGGIGVDRKAEVWPFVDMEENTRTVTPPE